MVQPLASGNALRVIMAPPTSATRIRLLRKSALPFSGFDDSDAVLIADGMDKAVTDYAGLLNGEAVWYGAFYLIGGEWVAATPKQGTPSATFVDIGPNVLSIVRDRLELGLKVYVDRGVLVHERGFIPTMVASPQVEEAPLPLVTVHLANDAPDMRAVGEVVGSDVFDPVSGKWLSFEGGISKTDLTIVAWSLNSDERITLRECIGAILRANFPVFDYAGLLLVSWNCTDMEDFERYQVPMYQVVYQFSCYAPSAISAPSDAISEVTVTNLGNQNG